MSRTRNGFTLIEVVISAAILAITLSMIIVTVIMLKGTVHGAGNRLEALNEGRNELEALLALSYTNAAVSVGSHSFASASGTYTGNYSVSTNASYPGLKEIALTIYWKDAGSAIVSSNTMMAAMSEVLH